MWRTTGFEEELYEVRVAVNGAFPSFSVAEVTGRGELAGGVGGRLLDGRDSQRNNFYTMDVTCRLSGVSGIFKLRPGQVRRQVSPA